MPYPTRTLGHSGIEVTTVSLGTMMFGSWGNPDPEECRQMFHRALDAGITLFDTADMYDAGVSETILGEAIGSHRDRIVLATKVGNPMDGDMTRAGLSRRWIVQACEDSLRRLQVDHIDLYQMHRPDPSTPIDETLAAFDELVTLRQGPGDRDLDLLRRPDRAGPDPGERARRAPLDVRATAVLGARPRDRDRGPPGVPQP